MRSAAETGAQGAGIASGGAATKWFNHCTTLRVPLPSPAKASDPLRVVRAFLAGAAATVADLSILSVLVSFAGVSPRVASVPALVVGGIVNFIGNRHFAFRASQGSLARQAALYTMVELVGLGLNGLLFDVVVRLCAAHAAALGTAVPAWAYAPIRLATSHVVFLAVSYPLWRLVFRVPARAEAV